MASNTPAAIDLMTLEHQGLVTPNWRLAAGIALLTEIQRGRSSDTQSSSDTGSKRDRKRSISSDGSYKKKKGKKSKESKGSDPPAGEEPPAAAFTPEPATPSTSTHVPTYIPQPPSKPNRPFRAFETAPKQSFKDSATDTTDRACMTNTLVTRGTSPLRGPTMVSTGTDPDARHPAFDSLPSDQEMDEVAGILDQRWEILTAMGNELGTQDESYIAALDSYSTSHQLYELVLLRLTAGRTRLAADLEVARSEQAHRLRQETENSLVLATAARSAAAAAASAPPSPAELLKRQAAASTVQVVLGSEETQAAVAALQAAQETPETVPQDPPRTPTKSPRTSPEPPLTPRGRRAVAKLADREASRPAAETQQQPSTSRSGAARTDDRHNSGTSHGSSSDRDRSRDRSSRRKKAKSGKDKDKSKKSSR